MRRSVYYRGILVAVALVVSSPSTPGIAKSSEPLAETVIAANPLIKSIYQRDPRAASRLVRELQSQIESHGAGAPRKPKASKDRPMIYRSIRRPDRRSAEERERDRKSIGENPLLQKLYERSPVASLRMLQRMREAAGGK